MAEKKKPSAADADAAIKVIRSYRAGEATEAEAKKAIAVIASYTRQREKQVKAKTRRLKGGA